MYEELVKRLRHNAINADSGNEIGEAFYQDVMQAADAIEELGKLADAIPHVCECCIGCEMEKKNGGCDNAFVLSPKRAMQYLIKPCWIPVEEQMPKEFVSVQAHMTDAGAFPSVREAYLAGGKWFFPALNEHHPVDKWAEFLEPLKEENHADN